MDSNNQQPMNEGISTESCDVPDVPRTQSISDRASEAKTAAARGLDRTASSLHAGANQVSEFGHSAADQVSEFGHSAADSIKATADYVRKQEIEGIIADVRDLVKRYPTQFLVGAAVLGFFVARGITRSRY